MKQFYLGCTEFSVSRYAKLGCILLALLLSGCGGSDGATGPAGPVGPTGSTGDPGTTPEPTYPAPTTLAATFNSVSIENGTVVANFNVADQDGHPYKALTGYRFSLVKLIPGTNGNSSQWQSYINRVEAAGAAGPGTEDKFQANTESNGTLVDNQDGSYSYTFATNVASVTEPLPVSYDATLTHRIALQLGGGDEPVANAVFDWQPSTGNVEGIMTRNIIKTESCNTCHGELALHGGGRKEVKYCVTCHNGGSGDANSGESVDFRSMIHKIHRGASLPSVVAGGEYAIWGYRNSKHDYSDVHLPQDIRNCTTCHDDNDPVTADAKQWYTTPTIEACGSCHDNVNFALGKEGGHQGGVMLDNSECTVCHKEGGFVGSVKKSHEIPEAIASMSFGFEIVSVTNTDRGQLPEITFKVVDPKNGNASYDIANHPAFTAGGGASRLSIDLAWGSGRDYTNQGSGSNPASVYSINALTAQDNGDGTFTAKATKAIPEEAQGTLAVAIEGHPAGDFDGDGVYSDRIPVPSILESFSINGVTVAPRREVVEIAKCQNCHKQLSLHGGNRTDNIQLCVTCHNPNNTDIARRPADPTTTPDGLKEVSIDFKQLIHGIHAADMRNQPMVVYGFGGSQNNFSDLRFPGVLNNCLTCHKDGTYELPLNSAVLATTADTGPLLNDPIDDLNITATAAVCSSCHDSQLTLAHMRQNGGASFTTSQQDVDDYVVTETCQFCHGAGQFSDVKKVHGIK